MSRLFRTSLMVALFMVLEKSLGFIHNVLIARQFQLTPEIDAFNAANNLPQMLFGVISGGAMGMVLIPALSEAWQKEGRPELWKLFSRVVNLIFLITGALAILIAVFAPILVSAPWGVAPGFSSEQQALVVSLMRWNLVATLLFSLAGLAIAGLQANQHFTLPALAPAMYDLGILFGVLILSPSQGYSFGPITLPAFGMGVYGLVYGTILGALLFFLVQVPGLLYFKFRWTPSLGLHNERLQRVMILFVPRALTLLCIYMVSVIQDNLASRLPTGSVTALVYGWLIFMTPETLIGTALGNVLLPTLSEQVTRVELEAYKITLGRSLRGLMALSIPLSIILGIVITPVISILGFNEAGTNMVIWTTRAYLLGLMGHNFVEIVVRAFYSQQKAFTPLWGAGFMLIVFTILAIPLGKLLGSPGFALANFIAYTAEAFLLIFILNRQMGKFLKFGHTPRHAIFAALAGGGATLGIFWILNRVTFFTSGLPGGFAMAIIAFIVGIAAAAPFIWSDLKQLVKL
jgi:putative peptidoglycan lipid II flippase